MADSEGRDRSIRRYSQVSYMVSFRLNDSGSRIPVVRPRTRSQIYVCDLRKQKNQLKLSGLDYIGYLKEA